MFGTNDHVVARIYSRVALMAVVMSFVACTAKIDQPDNAAALDDIRSGRSGIEVVVQGTVLQILPLGPSVVSGQHERFVIAVRDGSEQDILVAHNVSIAPAVPVHRGEQVIVRGELAVDPSGPVIHWTHHDPRFRHPPGFVELNGRFYE